MKIDLITDHLGEEGMRMEVDVMPPVEFLKANGWRVEGISWYGLK